MHTPAVISPFSLLLFSGKARNLEQIENGADGTAKKKAGKADSKEMSQQMT